MVGIFCAILLPQQPSILRFFLSFSFFCVSFSFFVFSFVSFITRTFFLQGILYKKKHHDFDNSFLEIEAIFSPIPQRLADFEEVLKKHGELSACAFVRVSFLFLPMLGK